MFPNAPGPQLAPVQLMDNLASLDSYYLWHAARADLLRRLNRHAEARAAYEKALSLAANAVDREYLRGRLKLLNRANEKPFRL